MPAKQLLTSIQKTNESRPDIAPDFILIQGRAGIGKTTLVNFITREWALGRLWQKYNWVFSLRFRDLRSGAFQQALDKKETWTLSDWIYVSYFSAQMDKPLFQTLWTWIIEPDIKANNVLFILDGYDEAPLHHSCEQALTDLFNSDTPKIVTSRPYGLSDLPFDRRELEIVGFIDENVDKYVKLYFKDNLNKAAEINKNLRNSPSLWGSAHIPVTLNVLCGVLETESDIVATITKLNTMSGLYETMEISLLERAYINIHGKEKEHTEQLKPLDKSSKIQLLTTHYKLSRHYLAKLAFVAFSKQQLILSPQDVTEVLKEFNVPVTEIATRIKELLDLGLLKKVIDEVTHQETDYEFLHLTFQEYYAGHYLLWQVEQSSPTILQDFAKIKLDPRYQIILWFVAGAIQNKEQFKLFMSAIAAPQGGDMLGNVQLGLMIRCTEENWELAKQTGWMSAITKMLQHRIHGLWKRYKRYQLDGAPIWVQMLNLSSFGYKSQTDNLDLFLDLSLKAKFSNEIIRTEILYFTLHINLKTPIYTKLYTPQSTFSQFDRSDESSQFNNVQDAYKFCETFINQMENGQFDSFLVDEDFLFAEEFMGRYNVPSAHEKSTIYAVINQYGSVIDTQEFFARLTKLLKNASNKVRNIAGEILYHLSDYIVISEILAVLPGLLIDENSVVRKHAILITGKQIAHVAIPEILSLLPRLLTDKDESVLAGTVEVVRLLGGVVAKPEIIQKLAKLLVDSLYFYKSTQLIELVISTIGKLGATTTILRILTRVAAEEILEKNEDDFDWNGNNVYSDTKSIIKATNIKEQAKLRLATAMLISEIDITETSEFNEILSKLFMDNDIDVRIQAAKAVIKGGKNFIAVITRLNVFERLAQEMKNNNTLAYRTIYELRSIAAKPQIIAELERQIIAGNTKAFEIIGELGSGAITPNILNELYKRLDSSDEYDSYEALVAICNFDVTTLAPERIEKIKACLIDSLEFQERRSSAAFEIICKFKTITAQPEFMIALTKSLAQQKNHLLLKEKILALKEHSPMFNNKDLKKLSEKESKKSDEIQLKIHNFERGAHFNKAQALSELVKHYLCDEDKNGYFPQNNFPLLASAIIVGSYISGNVSFSIAHDNSKCYHFRGFAEKTSFNISINHEQAQWFIYWVPKIIAAFEEGSLDAIIVQIEKAGLSSSSKSSVAWFDNLSSNSSSSSGSSRFSYHTKTSHEYKKAYGLCEDIAVNETTVKDKNCKLM